MNITHVVWDWNGTLLDDVACCVEVANQLLGEFGLPALDGLAGYHARFKFPIIEYYADLGFDTSPTGNFDAAARRYIELYTDAAAGCGLHAGASETLTSLKDAGLAQVIISASHQENLDAQVAPFALGRWLDAVHGIGDMPAGGVHLTAARRIRPSISTPVIGHQRTLHPREVEWIDGLPVTTLPRTLFDICGLVSPARRLRGLPALTRREVERAMDDALARTTSVAQLEQVLARLGGRGRGGTVLFRELLDERGEGFVATESELEDLLFAVLMRFGLPLPAKQVVLGGDRPVGRVDFVYREKRIVIEADSRRHHSALLDAERDRWRDLDLAADGFIVIRVTWRQLVDEPVRFVQALERLLARPG